jgi:pimeloyl-ACP methyl ester carboxylesterase
MACAFVRYPAMVDGSGADGRPRGPGEQPLTDPVDPTALEALHALASAKVDVTASFSHHEVYTPRGLLTVLRHEPPAGVLRRGVGIVACGGAMGGVLGPGHGLYHRLGERWSAQGVSMARVGYREPNNLDLCAHDLACGVEMIRDEGAEHVIVMGHSFGGAVAIRTAVIMPATVVGVVTFATQSAGCEVAGALAGRPLLLFHGDRDELLPVEASHVVAAIAGHGEVVVLPGDGHLLARSDDVIVERLDTWLPDAWRRHEVPGPPNG